VSSRSIVELYEEKAEHFGQGVELSAKAMFLRRLVVNERVCLVADRESEGERNLGSEGREDEEAGEVAEGAESGKVKHSRVGDA
jgi:hypothetical protein